ncbi:MAG: ion transporter [Alphaproteobacteria bacterium]|nr:ion transporter [Alphaproteobacteria bacterium]
MPEPSESRQRWRLLCQIEQGLETPMAVLGLAWAVLLVVDLVRGLPPALAVATDVIWGVFVFDFAVRFLVAPRKSLYLRRNVVTILSLALPAFRMLRFFTALRLVRGVRLVRVLTSLNRGIRSARLTSRRRGFGYVLSVTVLVTMVGAAGMHAFERGGPTGGFQTYGDSLWWTAMLLTSIASEYWPRTLEGRVLCLVLSLYGYGLFGYFTAMLASFFVGQDVETRPRRLKGD